MDRMEKVNELMRREISQMLQTEFQDPRLTFVTVTHVKVSRDLRHAKVGFTFLGDDKQIAAVEKVLDQIRGYVRKLVGQRVRIRYIPQIEFVYDRSVAYGARIEQTLQDIQEGPREQTGPEER